jgi:hypothetical protein
MSGVLHVVWGRGDDVGGCEEGSFLMIVLRALKDLAAISMDRV